MVGLPWKLSWLTDVPLNTFAMIIAWTWQQLGTNMVMFLMGLGTIPRDPIEACLIDGANAWQTFRHVKFPMLAPITTVVITMAMVNSFKVFDIIWVMTRGGPYSSSETLAVSMFRETFTLFNMGYGAAISVVLSAHRHRHFGGVHPAHDEARHAVLLRAAHENRGSPRKDAPLCGAHRAHAPLAPARCELVPRVPQELQGLRVTDLWRTFPPASLSSRTSPRS